MKKGLLPGVLLFVVFIWSFPRLGRTTEVIDDQMSGYRYSDFKDFEKNWKFVTVRYRNDTKEMRFTYANDLAYKALLQGSTDYPDGARFGKVSVRTQNDLAFPSSQVPSGKVRHTFMVRDKKKHKATGGWGYALFSPSGKPYGGDHQSKTAACAACHQIVKDQGQVFSKPMGLPFSVGSTTSWRNRIQFKRKSRKDLPQTVLKELTHPVQKIDLIQGPLQKNMFFGTLDEIRPILIERVKETGVAAGLISSDGHQFSVVYPFAQKNCAKSKGLKAFHSLPTKDKKVFRLNLCME